MSTTLVSGQENLTPPSETYREATLSLVYRLSELTFGSLLAAYSLGFVGAIAAHWAELSAHGRWGIVLLSVQYASISITFVYLTTSFYLMYHAGILMMPHMPLYRLREDFTLAVVQAVFFGISILRPWQFPILLGINFYLTIHRQNKEFKSLADHLYRAICKPHGRPDSEKFRDDLEEKLRKGFSELSGWRPIGWKIRIWATMILIVGLAVGYFVVELPHGWPLREKWAVSDEAHWNIKEALVTTEVFVVAAVITCYGWDILKKRAEFLKAPIKKANEEEAAGFASGFDKTGKQKERLKIDEQFDSLQEELAKLCAG